MGLSKDERDSAKNSQAAIGAQIANQTMFISDPNKGVVTPAIKVNNPVPGFVIIIGIAGIAYYAAKHYGWFGLVITIGAGVLLIRKIGFDGFNA